MKLSKWEQETIIVFNELEKNAEVYTHNQKLKKKFEVACEEHPTIFKRVKENQYGGATYTLPKKKLGLILYKPPSEKNKEIARANLKKARTRLKNKQK